MDPLSQVLSLLKPRSYITAGFDAGGDWSLLLDDLQGRIKCYAVLRGDCWLSLEAGEPVSMSAGDCFVLASGCNVQISSDPALAPTVASTVLSPHRDGQVVVYNGGGGVLLAGSRFEVKGPHAEALLTTLPPIIHLRSSADQAALRWSIELMMQELREARPGAWLIAQHLAHMMLAQALRLHLDQIPNEANGWLAGLSDPKIGAALAQMHAAPEQDWSLDVLARSAGLSRTVFAQQFRERMGETPIAYLTRWRMMLAADRLLDGGEPIGVIARSVGYESESAFTVAFKRVMGQPPRRFAAGA
ncbi:AraC family transcriptional regulator [Caulobacter sp. 73W]|uniref:AraC family transcriptional regulator n=1 Tax=Caulobacter sp. 73W TaxID=3161137 RepID=A0AB39KTZ2_9CAUL